MKKILLLLLSAFVLASCQSSVGPQGPQGPPGPEGEPGPVGQGFEVNTDFNASNNFSQIFSFPANIEVLDTDIVVAYLLYDVDGQTGNDVWQPLPATFYLDDGSQVQYGFDHTLADVEIFLGGNTDFSMLDPVYTDNQTFRVAILPVDYVQSNNIDVNNMNEVMSAVGKSNFKKITLIRK